MNNGENMKKTFLKSPVYAGVFIFLNLFTNAVLIVGAIYSLRQSGTYRFDFTWMIVFAVVFIGIIFNAHFAFLGVFTRVTVSENGIVLRRIFKTDTIFKLEKVNSITISKDMRHYGKTVEVPIILVEGYDDITQTNLCTKIDYRENVHETLIEFLNDSKKKTLKKMDRYFDKQPIN